MSNGATVTIMDGSMGRQLVLEGLPRGDLFHKIWAASALADPAYHELIVSGAKTMIWGFHILRYHWKGSWKSG